MSTHHHGDKIGTLATPTHQEEQMVSCTVCRKVKGRAKVEVSRASAGKSFGQLLLCDRWKSKKDRERKETAKGGMTAKVGQPKKMVRW